jgi:hypothetical protein
LQCGVFVFNILIFFSISGGEDKRIGTNTVPLKELKPNKPEDVIKDLYKTMAKDAQDANKRGQIVLELTYKPFKKDYKDDDNDDDPLEAGGGLLVVTV